MSYQLIAKCSVQQAFIRPKHNRIFAQRLLNLIRTPVIKRWHSLFNDEFMICFCVTIGFSLMFLEQSMKFIENTRCPMNDYAEKQLPLL